MGDLLAVASGEGEREGAEGDVDTTVRSDSGVAVTSPPLPRALDNSVKERSKVNNRKRYFLMMSSHDQSCVLSLTLHPVKEVVSLLP